MFKVETQVPTSGRTDAVLLFNKLNGLFITASSIGPEDHDKIDTTHYTYRAVQFDFVNDTVEGNLTLNADGTFTDNFKVVDKSEQATVVYEQQLNAAAEYKITKKYPVIEQINVLSRALQILAGKAKVELPELDEMTDYIKLCLDTNKSQKEFYSGNPDVTYITDEERLDTHTRRFEGGLHEALGTRTLTGGSVFKTGSGNLS